MDPASIAPVISPQTRDLLVPAGATGIVYLILSGQPMTWRLAIGALGASLSCGYFGTMAATQAFHMGPNWYSVLGAGFGFIGHMALMGVIKFGELWRQDPAGLLSRFIPFMRRRDG